MPTRLTERFLADVAAALTGRWTAAMIHEHAGRIIETIADGEQTDVILAAFCPHPGARVEWAGVFPRDRAGSIYMPRDPIRISVAADRPAAAIARDLERRLLQWYRPALEQALERVREADRREEEAQAAAEALGVALGQKPREGRLWFDQGTLEVSASGIRVHLTLPVTAGAAIGAALLPILTRADQAVQEGGGK